VLTPVRSAQFKRDVSRARARGRDLGKLRALLESLIEQEPLAARHRDHPLRGIWKRHREAHIEHDCLLVYRVKGDELHLVRTGTHSDLFRNQEPIIRYGQVSDGRERTPRVPKTLGAVRCLFRRAAPRAKSAAIPPSKRLASPTEHLQNESRQEIT